MRINLQPQGVAAVGHCQGQARGHDGKMLRLRAQTARRESCQVLHQPSCVILSPQAKNLVLSVDHIPTPSRRRRTRYFGGRKVPGEPSRTKDEILRLWAQNDNSGVWRNWDRGATRYVALSTRCQVRSPARRGIVSRRSLTT